MLKERTALRAELAEVRAQRDRMRNRIESLRGMLKSCAGWFLDLDRVDLHELCMEVAGDMEALAAIGEKT
jgi:signal transduction histidine kinase